MTVRSEWRGAQASNLIAQLAVSGLNEAAEALLRESQDLVPELTGGLEDSAVTHKTNPEELASQVQYRKYTAVWQHEKLNYRHAKGQAKFLEAPLVQHARRWVSIIASHLRRGL